MSYQNKAQTQLENTWDAYLEEIQLLGYTILPNIFTPEELAAIKEKVLIIYEQQQAELEGAFTLKDIDDEHVVRNLLEYDDYFIEVATKPVILDLLEKLLGEYYHLQLQNCNRLQPKEDHSQGSWHRDMVYQDFTASKPLGISMVICADEFTSENGGTWVLPGSHKYEHLPSDPFLSKTAVQATAPAGSVILMDTLTYHKAGMNKTGSIRVSIQQFYVISLISQQYVLPKALKGRFQDDPKLRRILGYESEAADSVLSWRKKRYQKFRKN